MCVYREDDESAMVFVSSELGEHSITTRDIDVNENTIIQFEVWREEREQTDWLGKQCGKENQWSIRGEEWGKRKAEQRQRNWVGQRNTDGTDKRIKNEKMYPNLKVEVPKGFHKDNDWFIWMIHIHNKLL